MVGSVHEVKDHSASMVLTLAFALCGGGQLMNGQWKKGALFTLSAVVLVVLAAVLRDGRLFGTSVLVWFVALVDAVAVGRRIARGEAVGQRQWFFGRRA